MRLGSGVSSGDASVMLGKGRVKSDPAYVLPDYNSIGTQAVQVEDDFYCYQELSRRPRLIFI